MTMRLLAPVPFAVALLVGGSTLAAAAAEAPKAPPAGEKAPGQLEEQSVSLEATVKAIDYDTRVVTLESAGGKTVTFKASEEVKRLKEIKVGDTVVAEYYESLMMRVLPAGSSERPGATVTEVAGKTGASKAPAGGVISQVEAVVEILGIDKAAKTVTIKTPDGGTKTVKARYPENLEKIKVGDRVQVVYTEALAIGIEPKKPAK